MELAHSNQDLDQTQTIELFWKTSWDFFTGGSGSKTGYTTDLKQTGCVLKTSEPIEFRRWIRMIIRDERTNVSFTAVGRVVRCENIFEASIVSEVTLYRYSVEFTYPLDLACLMTASPQIIECKSEFIRSHRSNEIFATPATARNAQDPYSA